MNVYDIAKLAGVSIATVSRVINHRDSVSAATAERVLKVIKENNYTPSSLARGLGRGRTQMVGVVCTDISDLYYASAVSYIESHLRAHGYDAILCCAGSEPEGRAKALTLLRSKGVEAIFLIGSVFKEQEDLSLIQEIAKKIPVLIINGELDIPGTYCFLSDEEQAVRHAAKKLIAGGRHRILYLYDAESPSGMKKLSGYRSGLQQAGLKTEILKVDRDLKSVAESLTELISRGTTFDAVIASEDVLAVGAINTLRRQRISIPKDVAVIGINNLMLAECCNPTLSSIDIQLSPLCSAAVKALLDLFARQPVPNRTLLPAMLIYRESFPK